MYLTFSFILLAFVITAVVVSNLVFKKIKIKVDDVNLGQIRKLFSKLMLANLFLLFSFAGFVFFWKSVLPKSELPLFVIGFILFSITLSLIKITEREGEITRASALRENDYFGI